MLLRIGVLLTLICLVSAQQPDVSKASNVHVEIIPTKKSFVEGETPRFRILLVNDGPTIVSIRKQWVFFGMGLSGFYVEPAQISGKKKYQGVAVAVDTVPIDDPRSPEQMLKEDYLDLLPGTVVGIDYELSAPPVGTYELSAGFATGDFQLRKLSTVDSPGRHMLVGEFKAKPLRFQILPREKGGMPRRSRRRH